jgi:hypothetical protein
MKHINIFETTAYNFYNVADQLPLLAKFLIDNRNFRITTEDINSIYRTNVLTNTAMKAIFETAVRDGVLDKFAPIKIGSSSASVPEFVTTDLFVFDILQIKDINSNVYNSINALPEFTDKIVLNFTQYLKSKTMEANDMPGIQSEIVKGLLIRSYYNSVDWLSPDLINYLAKSYSMIISSLISKTYNLDYNQQLIIATIFTIYFHQMCYDNPNPKDLPNRALNLSTHLGNRIQVKDTFDQIQEHLGDDLDLSIVRCCELIAKMINRLDTFMPNKLYNICQGLNSTKPMSNVLSLEYPPLWAHAILNALSGAKSSLAMKLKNIGDLKKESLGFAESLNKSRNFIPTI